MACPANSQASTQTLGGKEHKVLQWAIAGSEGNIIIIQVQYRIPCHFLTCIFRCYF